MLNEEEVIKIIKEELKTMKKPKKYRDNKRNHWLYGFCYPATITFYHYFGGKYSKYKVECAKDNYGIIHYWLKNKETDEVIDITKEQYTDLGLKLPYDNEKRKCDYRLSNEAKKLLRKLKEM